VEHSRRSTRRPGSAEGLEQTATLPRRGGGYGTPGATPLEKVAISAFKRRGRAPSGGLGSTERRPGSETCQPTGTWLNFTTKDVEVLYDVDAIAVARW